MQLSTLHCHGLWSARKYEEMRIMKYELFKGRPETDNGRLDKEIACYDFLDSLGMEYERIDHEEANTM